MINNGDKIKETKNRLTKLALEQTKFKDLIDLFTGPTAIAYSDDPVAPAKVSSNFEKNLQISKLLVVVMMEKKIDIEKINFLATLPSMDELRGKILGLISAPAQKIASIVKEPSGQLARLVSAHGENLDKSN
jgi:large subunit ribosomal protein L10